MYFCIANNKTILIRLHRLSLGMPSYKGEKRMVSVWHHLPDTYQTLTCRSRVLARMLPTAYREPEWHRRLMGG